LERTYDRIKEEKCERSKATAVFPPLKATARNGGEKRHGKDLLQKRRLERRERRKQPGRSYLLIGATGGDTFIGP